MDCIRTRGASAVHRRDLRLRDPTTHHLHQYGPRDLQLLAAHTGQRPGAGTSGHPTPCLRRHLSRYRHHCFADLLGRWLAHLLAQVRNLDWTVCFAFTGHVWGCRYLDDLEHSFPTAIAPTKSHPAARFTALYPILILSAFPVT